MKSLYIFILISLSIYSEPHPLYDLSGKEILNFKSVIERSKKFPTYIRYSILSLKEPNKQDILLNKASRTLKGSLFNPQKNSLYEVEVDSKKSKILSIQKIEGAQPPISLEDFDRLTKIVKQDKGWIVTVDLNSEIVYSIEDNESITKAKGYLFGYSYLLFM